MIPFSPLAVSVLLTLVAPVVGWATTVIVTPGPGTPLQDAINAAAPGTKLLLQEGTFTEAIVINKPLSLTVAAPDGPVVIDARSSSAAFAIDISADNVTLNGLHSTKYVLPRERTFHVVGGATAAIHVGAQTGIHLRHVGVVDAEQAVGLMLDGSLGVAAKFC